MKRAFLALALLASAALLGCRHVVVPPDHVRTLNAADWTVRSAPKVQTAPQSPAAPQPDLAPR